MRYIIVHDTDGIFVGHGLGFAFFSNMDPAGQTRAATFENENDAQFYVDACSLNPGEFRIETLDIDDTYATIEQLEAAGYGRFLDLMKAARLNNMEVAGTA